MICVNCGYEFYGQETLLRGVCPACGKSLTVRDLTAEAPVVGEHESDASIQLRAQVSTAINTRRIALVLVLAVVLTAGSTIVGLMVSTLLADDWDSTNIDTANAIIDAWLLVAAAITISGLYHILFRKRLSKL